MKVNKKIFKIIIVIIILIVIAFVGVIVAKKIIKKVKIEKIEQTLTEINADELQEKIINKLEDSDMNVSSTSSNTYCTTGFIEATEELGDLEGYIVALTVYWKNGVAVDYCAIPCFKIYKTSENKFESIEYLADFGGNQVNDRIVANIVKDIFVNDYNIDDTYHNYFMNVYESELNIDATTDTLINVFSMIDGEDKYEYTDTLSEYELNTYIKIWKNCTMSKFGINIK